jgi:hypothetical protein
MNSLLGLRTAIYPAPDLARAKAWYAQVLDQQPYFDEPFYVGFEVGGFELGLLPNATPGTTGPQPLWGRGRCQRRLRAPARARCNSVGTGDRCRRRHQGRRGDRPVRQPARHHREPVVRCEEAALSRADHFTVLYRHHGNAFVSASTSPACACGAQPASVASAARHGALANNARSRATAAPSSHSFKQTR